MRGHKTFLTLLLMWGFALHADLVSELERFKDVSAKRTGLEVEMRVQVRGLSIDEVTKIVAEEVGGKIDEKTTHYDYVDPSTGASMQLSERVLKVRRSRIGKVMVKPEDNSVSLTELAHKTEPTQILEIVTDPLKREMVPEFQKILDRLVARGAQGTTDELAVSLQVNVELGGGVRENIHPETVLSVLRNYLRPENRAAIAGMLNVPEVRRKYTGYPSPGFMERLMSLDYKPDWDQLYMDSMYRASLESLGHKDAWSLTDAQARAALKKIVKEQGFEPLLPVMKWNFVRYSSVMMFMRPDDWLTKTLFATGWFKPYPILEFREPNNDFQAEATVAWVLNFVAASEELPYFTEASLKKDRLAGKKSRKSCESALGKKAS